MSASQLPDAMTLSKAELAAVIDDIKNGKFQYRASEGPPAAPPAAPIPPGKQTGTTSAAVRAPAPSLGRHLTALDASPEAWAGMLREVGYRP